MEETKQQMAENSQAETPFNIIERAEAANKALEQNIRRQEELLRLQQEAVAKQLLAGRSNAGTTEIIPIVESAKDYAARVMKGEIKAK